MPLPDSPPRRSLRQNLINVLSGMPTDGHVPRWELHFHIWGKLSGKRYYFYDDVARLSAAEKRRALEHNASIMIEEAEAFGMSAITIPDMPWDCPYTLEPDDRLTLLSLMRRQKPDALLAAACTGVIAVPDSSRYIDFSYLLFDAPEDIDEECELIYRHGLEKLDRLVQAGVDMVYTASDLADNHGLYFNDEQMRRFVLPYLEKWAAAVKAAGIFPILHTDGNIKKAIDKLSATGVACIQAVDPVAGMDMLETLEQVNGSVCLCGNIDCGLLVSGTPEQVYESTMRLLQACGEKRGLVLGASNAVVTEVPLENYAAMTRAWRDYGVTV